jgi:Zn-dependent alcohol dehydrogenase
LRLHAASRAAPVDVEEWIATRRSMLIGASVTTPAAMAAALAPSGWSLPVAALVGVVAAAVCTAVLAF